MKRVLVLSLLAGGILGTARNSDASENSPELASVPPGWTTTAPRDEIKPAFAFKPEGGANAKGCFIIRADAREGLDGAWTKTFLVVGGEYYRFSALFQAKSVPLPRRSVVVNLDWQDAKGASVPLDEPTVANYLRGSTGMAETEFPGIGAQN